jgi:hypothetical protein
MKLIKNNKLLIVLLSVLLVSLSGCNGSAGEYGGKLIRPVNVYEVDGWGSNPDIYEFTPDGHPHMTCLILTSGGDSANGLQCFEKKKAN